MADGQHQASSIKHQESLLQQLVAVLAGLPGVAAITLGGSTVAGLADESSDLDVYVYYHEPLAASGDRARQLASVSDVTTNGPDPVEISLCGLVCGLARALE